MPRVNSPHQGHCALPLHPDFPPQSCGSLLPFQACLPWWGQGAMLWVYRAFNDVTGGLSQESDLIPPGAGELAQLWPLCGCSEAWGDLLGFPRAPDAGPLSPSSSPHLPSAVTPASRMACPTPTQS